MSYKGPPVTGSWTCFDIIVMILVTVASAATLAGSNSVEGFHRETHRALAHTHVMVRVAKSASSTLLVNTTQSRSVDTLEGAGKEGVVLRSPREMRNC